MTVTVGPGPELLDDPRRLAGGRVGQAIPDRLGSRPLLGRVSGVPLRVVLQSFDRVQLVRRLWRSRRAGTHRQREVDGGAVLGVLGADRGGDRRTPVAALRHIRVVAEACHQLGPDITDLLDAPAGLGRLAREAEPGQRRGDHMERIGGVAAVGGWVAEWLDHLVELGHRAGPAVRDQQGDRVGVRRALVDEVDVDTVDLGHELVEPVEPRLARGPVVLVGPVPAELLHVCQRHALRPVVDDFGVGPAGVVKTPTQVVELGLRDIDRERTDLLGHTEHGTPWHDLPTTPPVRMWCCGDRRSPRVRGSRSGDPRARSTRRSRPGGRVARIGRRRWRARRPLPRPGRARGGG